MQLSFLLEALGIARQEASAKYIEYKELKTKEDVLRSQLMEELESTGLKSVKGSDFSAHITEKPMITIHSEQAVIEWLRNAPDIESDIYIGIKPTQFQTLAKSLLKGTGEMIDGTQLVTSTSLSIKSNKKD